MFDNLSTGTGHRLVHQNLMTRALRPWDMFFNVMTRRKTRALLSALDDHLLKDIGVSRGEIDRIVRDTAGYGSIANAMKQRTSSIHQQPTSTKGKLP